MGNVRIVVHRKAVVELLTEPGVRDDLARRAGRIADAAGAGHRVETGTGPVRARAAVITDTVDARRREATERSLTRAVDAGR